MQQIMTPNRSRDAAEPGKGYAEKTTDRREKLDETPKNQNVETSP